MHTILLTTLLVLAPLPFACATSSITPVQDEKPDQPAPADVPKRALSDSRVKLEKKMPDGVMMTADLYRLPGEEKPDDPRPVLVCFHMTASSRAEYHFMGPRFNQRGCHALSVDLRCGGEGENTDRRTKRRYGTPNETWMSAKKLLGHDPDYKEAYGDLPFAVAWARELFPGAKIGLVGSSYSASLVLIYATEHPGDVAAVFAFSPGEYIEGWSVAERVKKLATPAYITCGNNEADNTQAKGVARAIEMPILTFFPQDEGFIGNHGAGTLHIRVPDSQKKQWEMFDKALEPLVKKKVESPPLSPK